LRVSDQLLRLAPDSLPGSAHRHSVESARRSRSAAYGIPISRDRFVLRFLSALCLLTVVGVSPVPARRAPLQLIYFTTGELSVNVSATVIVGPTEAIVVDCLAFAPDAAQVADSIAKLGTHLKAIYVTHADIDHYLGCAKLVERFPGTPVYMAPNALDRYKKVSGTAYAVSRKSIGTRATLPDSLVTVQPLPSNTLTVDGEELVIHPDVQGDAIDSQNSFIWIPSLRAVLADDSVFNQVHAFLAAVTTEEGHSAGMKPFVASLRCTRSSSSPRTRRPSIRQMRRMSSKRWIGTSPTSTQSARPRGTPGNSMPRCGKSTPTGLAIGCCGSHPRSRMDCSRCRIDGVEA
jgi:metallo-beta-lactamase superfamily protein